MVRALGVIPARFAATRFPGKPLAPLAGRPVIEHVWRGASGARRLERLVVATDDDRIVEACARFGAEAVRTSPDHPSGSDRVAEAARSTGDRWDVIVNVQGDEPFVEGRSLDRIVEALDADRDLAIATLAEPIETEDEIFDPSVVKVVLAHDGRALYFSRAPIPFRRGGSARPTADFRAALADRPGGLAGYLKHQGVYAYRAEILFDLCAREPSPLEIDECLEQLRAMQAGYAIRVLPSDFRSIAIDTPSDLERAAARLAAPKEGIR